MDDKSNNLNEQLKIHGQAIQKSMSGISENAKKAIENVNRSIDNDSGLVVTINVPN